MKDKELKVIPIGGKHRSFSSLASGEAMELRKNGCADL